MNLSPFATRFTWSLVSSILESFLICFLLASKVSCFCAMRLNFLRSLRFLFATLGLFVTLFPSLVLGDSDNRQTFDVTLTNPQT